MSALVEDFAWRVAKMRAAIGSGSGVDLAAIWHPWLHDSADKIVAALRKAEAPTHDEAMLAAIQRYDDWRTGGDLFDVHTQFKAAIDNLREVL